MQHYTNTLYDTFGNAISGATVSVYAAGTTTLSTIYSDNLSTSTTNPLTTGADGSYDFYAADGRYDLVITHASHTFTSADTAGISLFDVGGVSSSWTPSVGGTATYTTQTGSQIKIGPLVIAFCALTILTIGTGSTTTISGLTYPVHATLSGIGGARFGVVSQNVVSTVVRAVPGTSTLQIQSLTSAGADYGLNSLLTTGTTLNVTVAYLTTA